MNRIVVLGGGESGVGAAILAKKKEFKVFLSDKGSIAEKYQKILAENSILWESGAHTESVILNADLVVKSPGIPENADIIVKLKALNIPVISEIEFAYKYNTELSIAITGSNGKTTTTMLTYEVLKADIENLGLAGNIGNSYAAQVAVDPDKLYVLELSSFQLDGIVDYRPHIAVLTNLSPDHLDRYEYKYENYIDSKFRITENQTEEDYFIYDADDSDILEHLKKIEIKSQLIPFSITKKLERGTYLEGEHIMTTIVDSNEEITTTSQIALEGKHNLKNSMAAITVAQLMKIRKETIRESLKNFQGVEHRLEKVLKIENVQYINDSKATNVNAAFYALESMNTPTVWIVGGVDKGNNYEELRPLVIDKVKSIVCLGIDNQKIIESFRNVVNEIWETTSMEEAVQIANKISEKGDTVLLSPACASFDLFKNYEDRGEQFKKAVFKL